MRMVERTRILGRVDPGARDGIGSWQPFVLFHIGALERRGLDWNATHPVFILRSSVVFLLKRRGLDCNALNPSINSSGVSAYTRSFVNPSAATIRDWSKEARRVRRRVGGSRERRRSQAARQGLTRIIQTGPTKRPRFTYKLLCDHLARQHGGLL